VGAFFILWDESLLVLYMTSSTLDDARGAGLGGQAKKHYTDGIPC
jgi:hypothetical protein